ncbi:hypothetical protein D3C86_2148980 [compost metagenome]
MLDLLDIVLDHDGATGDDRARQFGGHCPAADANDEGEAEDGHRGDMPAQRAVRA